MAPENFARLLQHLMQERDISVAELAVAARLSQPTIYQWLRGSFRPSATSCGKLAKALGVPVQELRAMPVVAAPKVSTAPDMMVRINIELQVPSAKARRLLQLLLEEGGPT